MNRLFSSLDDDALKNRQATQVVALLRPGHLSPPQEASPLIKVLFLQFDQRSGHSERRP